MSRTFKSRVNSFLMQSPILRNFALSRQYPTEIALIKGSHKNSNNHPSIIHFSVNKAATQYVKGIIQQCSSATGLANVGIHDYAFKSDFPYLNKLCAEEMQKYQHIFKPKGYTYSVFGGMIDGLQALENYLVVLMVRDPRDVLVSEYYSVAYSHVEPTYGTPKYDTFREQRIFAQSVSVDDYVISQCEACLEVYSRYKTLLLDKHPKLYITKYEEMVSDFEEWLSSLINYCQFDVSNELYQEIVSANDRLRPRAENVKKHIRKGKAGDYKEKLKTETIGFIESKLSSILASFGYI